MNLPDYAILGLGTAALGRPGYINLGHAEALGNTDISAMEAQAHAVFDRAEALGIRYLDAARSYGKAEAFLASWMAKDPARSEHFTLASKWGYTYTADWQIEAEAHEVKEHSLEKLNSQWELSSALLPSLNLYQIHSATFATGVLENAAIHHRLNGLRQEYGIAIGLSTSGVDQPALIDAACKVMVEGKPLFDAIQVTYNILEGSCAPALARASDRGMRIIIKEALANGRLTPANQDADFKQKAHVLFALAETHQVSIDAIALAYVLQQPFVDVVLSGAASVAHLNSNAQALNIKLTGEELEALAVLEQNPEAYWNVRSGMAWN
ncbi:MAG: aldo/keto reductase [Bacteroidia bacterium]